MGGIYREGKETIAWKNRTIAVLSEPSGIKSVHWSKTAIIETFGDEYQKVGKSFSYDAFEAGWKQFLENAAKRKVQHA